MRRNCLFVALLFVASVALSVVQKVVFLIKYASLAEDATTADFFAAIRHGLILDTSVAGYIVALPILVVLASVWLPTKSWASIIKWYLLLAAAAASLVFVGNLGLYEYWAFPLDVSVMQYLATPKEAAASITLLQMADYTLLFIASFALSAWCYLSVLRLFNPSAGKSDKTVVRIVHSIAVLFLGGLAFLAIRGGISVSTANVSKVYFSRRMFLNHAAVNPVFSLLASSAYDKGTHEYEFFDDAESLAVLESVKGDAQATVADTLLRTTRPNIVLILAESFGRSTADATIDGVAVAPNFQRLKREGVWFENFYANSFRTDRGMVAILSGFPAQTRSSVMKNPAKSRRLASIARSLQQEGYATSFVYGGDPDFTNTASYLYGTGYEQIIGQYDLQIDAPTSKWGYADDIMADAFLQHLDKCRDAGKPFLATWLTLSSHEPFDVPVRRFDDTMLNSMAFADACIAKVVDTLHATKAWDDTLIIVVADHAYSYPYGIAGSAVERHHIPMLWTGGAVRSPRTIPTYASQTDLAATLLAQMGIAHDDFVFSRDILGPTGRHFGYYTFNNGFGVVDDSGATVYDCTSSQVISPDSSEVQLREGKAILQMTYKTLEQL
ncbi:MAG: LTA synthase family protein [Alistipes sp.]